MAEIEADERAGIAVTAGPLNTSSVMLALPLPNKVAVRADPVQKSDPAESEPYRDDVDSIKRSYSDIQDSYDENGLRKTQRIHGRGSREDDTTSQRPRSSGYDSPRRLSSDYRDERDSSRSRCYEDRLRKYESEAYELVRCLIEMNGSTVQGCTCRFVGEID